MRPWLSSLFGALALALPLCVVSPAQALVAVPARSHVLIGAPLLAPGTWGNAPLSGALAASGAFSLHTAVDSLETGSSLHDTLVRRFFHGTVTLQGTRPWLVGHSGHTRRVAATATMRIASITSSFPVLLRLIDAPGGKYLRTSFKLPLAAYGVRNPRGGSPGDVRVVIDAYFTGR